jgi:hypothetical protein
MMVTEVCTAHEATPAHEPPLQATQLTGMHTPDRQLHYMQYKW